MDNKELDLNNEINRLGKVINDLMESKKLLTDELGIHKKQKEIYQKEILRIDKQIELINYKKNKTK